MNFIKYFTLTGIIILYGFAEAFACHNEFNDPIAGHKSKFSFNMTTVPTEATSAYISTSTQCKWYANFIREGYQFIAEEASQGQGNHLKVLAQMMGCPVESFPEFATTLQIQYDVLFDPTHADAPQRFLQKLENLVVNQPDLNRMCLRI